MKKQRTPHGMRPQTVGVQRVRYVSRAKERGRKLAYEYPSIHVAGKWLTEAGFKVGDVLVPELTADGDLLLRRQEP